MRFACHVHCQNQDSIDANFSYCLSNWNTLVTKKSTVFDILCDKPFFLTFYSVYH